ncbi:response regulator [Bacillus gobiensis]|uniref:response regulator transcription factor n=1 Tax=Bacillus gobiensis TaxID=1441095 RepID=UPI003D1AC3AA
MYRVLIVDDEPAIRKGIASIIDWKKEGMQAEDHYANGKEAMDALDRSPCDILITDIKMPIIDGIELMEQALKRYPSIKVIMISNYSDFEYVKEGMRLGAVDYLLKLTLKQEDLLSVLRRCISMLEKEQKLEREMNDYQEGAIYLERKKVEHEIKRLIVQERSPELPMIWAPHWLEKTYDCIYLMLDHAEEWRENQGYLYVNVLLEDLQEDFYNKIDTGMALIVSETGMFLILPDNNGESEQELLQWKDSVEKQWNISTSIGLVRKKGKECIIQGYMQSKSACHRRFFEGLGKLYIMDGAKKEAEIKDAEIDSENVLTSFYELIRNGDPVSSAIEIVLKRWNSGDLNPEQVQQEACSLLKGVYDLYEDSGILLSEQHDQLKRTETLEQLVSLLIFHLEEITKPFIPKLPNNGQDGQLITKALEYIAANYRENLTLQSVAEYVHLSRSYFSLFFKKHTGRNFIDYLIDLRIREAKRQLTQNDSRIYDVAKAAGFKDVKYFSKVFKKVAGSTPHEYREKHHKKRMSID